VSVTSFSFRIENDSENELSFSIYCLTSFLLLIPMSLLNFLENVSNYPEF